MYKLLIRTGREKCNGRLSQSFLESYWLLCHGKGVTSNLITPTEVYEEKYWGWGMSIAQSYCHLKELGYVVHNRS